ncbi:MAG: hypothetical protein WA138_13240, partial [Parvibaculum sp.]
MRFDQDFVGNSSAIDYIAANTTRRITMFINLANSHIGTAFRKITGLIAVGMLVVGIAGCAGGGEVAST